MLRNFTYIRNGVLKNVLFKVTILMRHVYLSYIQYAKYIASNSLNSNFSVCKSFCKLTHVHMRFKQMFTAIGE